MKATGRDFTALASRAARECALFFFCGPDEAGAAAAADKLVAQLADPGERVELSGSQLKADPVRLADEARSSSLFGGTRHLFVRAAGEEAHDAVKLFCELADAGETRGACPVLIHATSASDKSRTAKLLSGRKDALVAMFYPPQLADVTAEVRMMADAAGVRLGGDLAERIARGALLDLRVARSEIAKLALYLDASPQAPRLAGSEALAEIGAVSEEEGFAPLVNAVMAGELDKVPSEIRRMRELGLNPVAVALALERRAAQLAARLGQGGESKPAFYERSSMADRDALTTQLNRWSAGKLERLITRLAELHRALLAPSASAELLVSQALVQIARVAAGRPR